MEVGEGFSTNQCSSGIETQQISITDGLQLKSSIFPDIIYKKLPKI